MSEEEFGDNGPPTAIQVVFFSIAVLAFVGVLFYLMSVATR